MSVALTANYELPIPAHLWAQLALHPGEEFEVIAEEDRLVAIRKAARPHGDVRALMTRLHYVEAGGLYGRDEANER